MAARGGMAEIKRPIDKKRESAGSFKVTTDDDSSPIVASVIVGDRMLIVKELGVYELKFADQIDPERVNPDVPNTVQKVLSLGSTSDLVARTILLAEHLVKPSVLPKSVDCDRVMQAMFQVMMHLGKMYKLLHDFKSEEERGIAEIERQKVREDGSYVIPTSSDLGHNVESFLHNANLALVDLLEVAKAFGETNPGKKWFEGIVENWRAEFGDDSDSTKYLSAILPFLKLVRNARHCLEHEKEGQRLEVHDFSLGTDLLISPPSVEIVHPETPISTTPISQFMSLILERLIDTSEAMLVLLCEKQIVKSENGFTCQVIQHPEGMWLRGYLRFSYAMEIDGKLIPMS